MRVRENYQVLHCNHPFFKSLNNTIVHIAALAEAALKIHVFNVLQVFILIIATKLFFWYLLSASGETKRRSDKYNHKVLLFNVDKRFISSFASKHIHQSFGGWGAGWRLEGGGGGGRVGCFCLYLAVDEWR